MWLQHLHGLLPPATHNMTMLHDDDKDAGLPHDIFAVTMTMTMMVNADYDNSDDGGDDRNLCDGYDRDDDGDDGDEDAGNDSDDGGDDRNQCTVYDNDAVVTIEINVLFTIVMTVVTIEINALFMIMMTVGTMGMTVLVMMVRMLATTGMYMKMTMETIEMRIE